jgi:subtilase family serine protease
VVAPGTWILSGYSDRFQEGYDPAPNPQNGLYQYDGWGFPLNQAYKYMGGTSMAAPLAAGGAAVVRDYYNKAHSHEASAALVKATLINSAVDLLDENNDGVDDNAFPIPNAHEGWGRVDLARATDGSHQFDDETVTLTTGASASFNYEVTSAGFPLRVTIVWTDFPSTTSAATNLVNDLDLQVIGPDGIPYRGNALVGGWSVAGGAADRVNNVENVYLPAASSGTWTITVNGYNVPFGFQPFALVVDGALAGAGTPLPSVRVVATDTSATEAGLTTGAFTFTRNGSTDAAMAVTYAVTGTATATTDYTALSGSITIPEGASDVTLLVQPIDDSTSEANETVVVSVVPGTEYGAGSPASATVTIVSDDLPPDLVLSSLTVPAATAPGATFSVSETTKNQGAAAASASETGFYLSLNLIFEPTDVFVGSRAVSALAPGAQEARTTSLVVPTTVAPGLYYLMARADWSNALLESQEGNNLRMSGGMRVGPDLLVSVLTVAASVAAGSTVPISDTTFNQGGGTASASVTAFYLSTNTGVDAADTLLGSRVVNSVAANAGHAASTSVTIPPATPVGIYYVLAVADHQAQVTEAHENNNVRASGQVKVGADLVVSALTAPGLAAAGAPISVSETTKNEGAGLAGASVTNFYLSPNVSYEATDTFLGQRIVPNLGPGVADSGSVSLTIPPSTVAGLYFVVGRADADDNVAETSEINNTRASAVVRVGPDLTVTTVTAPVVGGAGQTLTVTESIKNAGGDAAAASQSDFYLSIDPTLDASDVLLGNRAVPSIGAGATNTGPTTLMIPASTATGSYYVISKADATSVITEAQETNNTGRSATVRIGPDLIVTAFTGTTTVTAGASLTVNDTVSNSGGAVAATTTTHFYLSTNALLDAADTLIGSRVVAELGPGMTETIATPLPFSASLPPATYYLFVKADGPGALVETNETNNTRVYAVRVIAP